MFFPGQIAAPAFDDSIEPNKISVVVETFMHLLVAIVIERARITDPRVRKLAYQIIESQRKEIADMKALIEDIEGRR